MPPSEMSMRAGARRNFSDFRAWRKIKAVASISTRSTLDRAPCDDWPFARSRRSRLKSSFPLVLVSITALFGCGSSANGPSLSSGAGSTASGGAGGSSGNSAAGGSITAGGGAAGSPSAAGTGEGGSASLGPGGSAGSLPSYTGARLLAHQCHEERCASGLRRLEDRTFRRLLGWRVACALGKRST